MVFVHAVPKNFSEINMYIDRDIDSERQRETETDRRRHYIGSVPEVNVSFFEKAEIFASCTVSSIHTVD